MSPKPFDLESALTELRAETPSPDARLRARRALARRPRVAWRFAAVTGALSLLLLPVALRTRGSEASAITLAQVVRASLDAPYVVQTMDRFDAAGRPVPGGQAVLMWAPRRRVERLFFREDGQPGREIRRLPGRVFERRIPATDSRGWAAYEIVQRTHEPVGGTDEGAFAAAERAMAGALGTRRPERTDGRFAWFRLQGGAVWKVETASRRIVRMESGSGPERTVSDFAYPSGIDSAQLDVPPVGKLPRFDLDAERAEMDRLNRVGDRVKGGAKLVGVFQEVCAPGQPVYVAYEGKGLARAKGLSGGGLTTLKSIPPKVVATVFPTKGLLKTLDVEIPAAGGTVSFTGVRVRPVSEQIRSGLRTPPFE